VKAAMRDAMNISHGLTLAKWRSTLATAPKNSTAAQPPKFKVGDEVIRTDRPFGLREIITRLPVTDAGERQYRIGPPPMRSRDGTVIKAPAQAKQHNVGESQLMKLEEVLDELLKEFDDVEVKRDEATRNALLEALCCARNDLTKKLPPAELVKTFEKSIATVKGQLAELTKYRIPKEITDHVCKIGAGVVNVLPLPFETPKTFKVFQLGPPFEGTATVGMQDLLSDWYDSVKKVPRKKREGQKREDRLAIVFHAAVFLLRYFGIELSTNPKDSIHRFVELFYERVTARRHKRGFDHQFRRLSVAKKSRSNS
jgi:hypothetical protein